MESVADRIGYIYGLRCSCHPGEPIRYVGQTRSRPELRLQQHLSDARNGGSRALYNWVRKHGCESVVMIALSVCQLGDLDDMEQFWVEELGTFARESRGGLNLTRGGRQRIPPAAINREQAVEIVKLLEEGFPQTLIAEEMGITSAIVSEVSKGTVYPDITENLSRTEVTGTGRAGKLTYGEANNKTHLTRNQVIEMREAYNPKAGVTTYWLAEYYNMSPVGVQSIIKGETWKHLLPEDFVRVRVKNDPNAILTEDDVRDIKARLAVGKRGIGAQLAREYGVSQMTISDIRRGATWTEVE